MSMRGFCGFFGRLIGFGKNTLKFCRRTGIRLYASEGELKQGRQREEEQNSFLLFDIMHKGDFGIISK